MNFSVSDGIDLGGGWGIVLVIMILAFGLSVWHYNSIDRPEEERELADAHEAEAMEERAIHENDVPRA